MRASGTAQTRIRQRVTLASFSGGMARVSDRPRNLLGAFGFGFGLDDESPDFRIRMGLQKMF